MKSLLPALLSLAVALPLWAADLDPRYEAMGHMTVRLGEERLEMVIPWDTEKDRGYAERKMIMGSFLTINTLGRVVQDSGKPGQPMLQVTLQEQGGKMRLLSAEIFDDQGFDAPLAMGADGGDGELTSYALDGDMMTATVEGTFLRLTGYQSEPRPADGAAPVAASISLQVRLPPLE